MTMKSGKLMISFKHNTIIFMNVKRNSLRPCPRNNLIVRFLQSPVTRERDAWWRKCGYLQCKWRNCLMLLLPSRWTNEWVSELCMKGRNDRDNDWLLLLFKLQCAKIKLTDRWAEVERISMDMREWFKREAITFNYLYTRSSTIIITLGHFHSHQVEILLERIYSIHNENAKRLAWSQLAF